MKSEVNSTSAVVTETSASLVEKTIVSSETLASTTEVVVSTE